MKDVKVEISGVTPLLMNRFPGTMPSEGRRPTTITQDWIDADRKKKWLRAAHFSEGTFHVPPDMLEGALYAAATKFKKKDSFKKNVIVVESFIPLLIKNGHGLHPLKGELEEFFKPDYIDIRGVPTKAGPCVEQCRPIFRNWGVRFTYRYDEMAVNPDDIRKTIETMYLGSFRPRFGKVKLEKFDKIE